MKNINISGILFFSFSLFLLFSCKDDSGVSESGTEVTLPGAPELIQVNPGNNRAEVVWNVKESKNTKGYGYVYWNGGKDSVAVIGRLGEPQSKSKVNLSEGDHEIFVKNLNNDGVVSVPSNKMIVNVYGDSYKENVEKSSLIPPVFQDNDCIVGFVKSNDCIGVNLSYQDLSGEKHDLTSSLEESSVTLSNAAPGSTLSYSFMYKPSVNALDTITTDKEIYILPMSGEPIIVESIDAMIPYLSMDNVEVTLKKGTYRVTALDVKTGKYRDGTAEVVEGLKTYALFLVSGNNSTYDFGGSTIEIETAVFSTDAYGTNYREFYNVHTLGNHNTVKNLILRDIGKETDFPIKGCTNIIMDGSYNILENVELHSTGSYPYGYGELFGKGGSNVTIKHHKHCGCLVRGMYNTLKDSKIYHRGYGHCVFMQGCYNPTIEGCYVEGDVTTTDAVLAEEGTGSAADKIDFKTTWGYRVPPGYTIAKTEEGIRAYNGGNTMVDGVRYEHGTSDVMIRNCTVVNARAGVTLTHATGTKYVENCETRGCERGYAVGTGGKIVNCRADLKHGHAFEADYSSDRNIEAEITIIPYEGEEYNGSKQAAIIIGSNHRITLKKGPGLDNPDQDLVIYVGGDDRTIGQLYEANMEENILMDENYSATGITLINETGYPVLIDDNAKNNNVSSVGKVTDNGTGNTVTQK